LFVAVCSAAIVPFPRRSEVEDKNIVRQPLRDVAGNVDD